MSKILLRTLILALSIVVVLVAFNRLQVSRATPDGNSSEPQGETTRVEVTFDGLMVFQKVDRHYEVGILDKADHEFMIIVGGASKKVLDKGMKSKNPMTRPTTSEGHWTLQVVTYSGTGTVTPKPANIWPREVKGCNRLTDTIDGEDLEHVFDFCWIMDLEREFHGNQMLTLKPGLLKPIIWLNHGELYTKYKYDELKREQSPDGNYAGFGFAAETIGLRVDLREDEHLELREPDGSLFFSLPTMVDGKKVVNAGFFNAPPMKYHAIKKLGKNDHSHFLYYYDLFSNVAPHEKVDIAVEEANGHRPLNRWYLPDLKYRVLDDKIRLLTFDDQACGGVFLGKSTSGLGGPK